MTAESDRLARLIAAHGSDATRWPAAERQWMLAEIERRPDAALLLAAERALDAQLDALQAPPPAIDLRRRVLLEVALEPRGAPRSALALLRELWRELGGARVAAPAMVMAVALGLGMGWVTTPVSADDAIAEDLLVLAQFEDSYEEFLP